MKMKTRSIIKKYEKLSSEYGKAVTTLVELHQKYESDPTDWNRNLYEEANSEYESAKEKFYSFADKEWR